MLEVSATGSIDNWSQNSKDKFKIREINYAPETNRLKQAILLFIMWTTIILAKSTNNLVFLTNFIVEPILSLIHLTQSLLHLNHNLVSLNNIMVVHIMNN